MNTILTDDEVIAIKRGTKIFDTNPWAESRSFARAVEAAVLAKRREQEPRARVELIKTGGNAGLSTRIVELDHPLRERLNPGTKLYAAPLPAVGALADLRNAKWLDPECAEAGCCQSLRFKSAATLPAVVQVPQVTDAMALAFHLSLTDGDIGQSEVDEIKTGLRAAFAAAPEAPAQTKEQA